MKLIAEPWDVGPGGYQVGNFPILWSEWNGIYRDTVRDFWRGQSGVSDFASRFGGSSDLYERDGRRPFASINFVTAHDGFTLHDLVSYNEKHNEANGEGNADGTDDNRSWNCGVEGETDDPDVNDAARAPAAQLHRHIAALAGRSDAARRRRALAHAGRQQQRVVPGQRDLVVRLGASTTRATAARVLAADDRPASRASGLPTHAFFSGSGDDLPDVWWMRPDGRKMTQRDWRNDQAHAIGVFLNGDEVGMQTPRGEEVRDDSFLVLFNAHYDPLSFRLPTRRFGRHWEWSCHGRARPRAGTRSWAPARKSSSSARSILVLRRVA